MIGRISIVVLGLVVAATILGVGCAPQVSRLRIKNDSAHDIQNLTVIFPDERLVFGNVAAGATTEYKPTFKGVYQYAAYELDVNGKHVMQPVIDWVGEEPMRGLSFTYTLRVDPNATESLTVELVNV